MASTCVRGIYQPVPSVSDSDTQQEYLYQISKGGGHLRFWTFLTNCGPFEKNVDLSVCHRVQIEVQISHTTSKKGLTNIPAQLYTELAGPGWSTKTLHRPTQAGVHRRRFPHVNMHHLTRLSIKLYAPHSA